MSDYNIRPDAVQEKKLAGYNPNLDDFVASKELTVTITLSEYRSLVGQAATRKEAIDQANKDKYSREQEIKTLNETVASLKAENYELQKRITELRETLAVTVDEADDEEGVLEI